MDVGTALRILREHTFVTVGCTDPVAVGLAAAHAARAVGGRLRALRVEMDENVYKDAFSVGIPGTPLSGIDLAAALGGLYGIPSEGLELFRSITLEQVEGAQAFLRENRVEFALKEGVRGIYVAARATTDRGVGEAILRHAHDRVSEVRVNGVPIREERDREGDGGASGSPEEGLSPLRPASIAELTALVESIPAPELSFLAEGVRLNRDAAAVGARSCPGMALGAELAALRETALLGDDLPRRVRQTVAAAADARMCGLNVPIYGCFGSGNHGITLFLTVGLAAEELGAGQERTTRALALALLVVGAIKTRTGILTPHCGCAVAAGTGAAAAVAWLLGGTPDQVESATQLMAADLTGMLCDGAKAGCALKIATSAESAVISAYLAVLRGVRVPPGNGIVGRDFQETLDHLQILTESGMADVDRSVLRILLGGSARGCPL